MIINDSALYLCANVELDPEHEYTIDFDDLIGQNAYFDSKIVKVMEDDSSYSYIRKDESIRVNANVDDLLNVNYLYFINSDGKRYYCFITDKRYINNETSELIIKLDVMQTFMFNYELGECFVEREHQDRWVIGGSSGSDAIPIYNLETENVDYGSDYLIKDKKLYPYMVDATHPIMFAYCLVDSHETAGLLSEINGIVQGYSVIVYPFVLHNGGDAILRDYDVKVNLEGSQSDILIDWEFGGYMEKPSCHQIIISPFAPFNFEMSVVGKDVIFTQYQSSDSGAYAGIEGSEGHTGKYGIFVKFVDEHHSNELVRYHYSMPDEEAPIHTKLRNIKFETKLKAYPYNFRKINNRGKETIIKNEYLGYPTIIEGYQSMSSEGSSAIVVKGYKGNEGTSIYDVITNQLPTFLTLATDKWEQYMLQNRAQRTSGYINQGISLATGVVSGFASTALTGGLGAVALIGSAGQAVSGFMGISNQIAKEKDIKNQPADVHEFSGDLNMTMLLSDNTPIESTFDIMPSYKSKVYNYLYHYGYKCNDFKIPDVRSRYYFNFIKNTSTTIKSNISIDYINEIKNIYNKGITIWHKRNGGDFYGVNTYTYENAEMSLEGGK